jgi:hypothetical protein
MKFIYIVLVFSSIRAKFSQIHVTSNKKLPKKCVVIKKRALEEQSAAQLQVIEDILQEF